MTTTYLYFLAHDMHDTDEEIDSWIARLEAAFNPPGQSHRVVVHPGRNDFPPRGDRQRRLGSWPAWQDDIASGLTPMGEDRYIGIIRPAASFAEPIVIGRGTVPLFKKMLALNEQRARSGGSSKYVMAWCHGKHDAPNNGKLVNVTAIGKWKSTGHRGADSKTSAYLSFDCPDCGGNGGACPSCPGHVYGDEMSEEMKERSQRAEAAGLNTQTMVTEGRVVSGKGGGADRTLPAGPPPPRPPRRPGTDATGHLLRPDDDEIPY
tara:strand:- start:658 stop:1446 length:789 start_codon:yes stop_codon:yes gene_type:complete